MVRLGVCVTECDWVSTARIHASYVAPNHRGASSHRGGRTRHAGTNPDHTPEAKFCGAGF